MFYQYQICDLQTFSPLPFHSVDSVIQIVVDSTVSC